MGWIWAGASASKASAPQEASGQAASGSAPHSTATSTTAASELDGDPELQKFFAMIHAEMASNKPAAKEAPAPPPPPPPQSPLPPNGVSNRASFWSPFWSSPSASSPPQTDPAPPLAPPNTAPGSHQEQQQEKKEGRNLSLADSLLPTTMSCRQAFDLAFYCQSPGGQFNAVYRHGSMRSCSEHWADFRFCMRVKGYSEETKAAAIREHYRQREARKYGPGQPSSEDVWEGRDEKVAPETAFAERYDVPVVSDAGWQAAEIERRRRIREGLGIEESGKGS